MNSVEWLTKLVAFDTTSRNSNLTLIHTIKNYCEQYGMKVRITKDKHEDKANLFATLPAADGKINGGIILSGHTDVVPVDGQEWFSDPFTLTEKNQRLYGRGTADMKGFLAVALSLLPSYSRANLSKPVHFAFSYDEEVGCRGAPFMIEDFIQEDIRPEACIVGEPTNMQPVIAHKGIQVFRCRVHGHATHSSLTPQGCNAIEYAAQLICYIRELAEKFRHEEQDEHFDVPFTTVTTNKINGGIADNTIPELCEFIFEFRHLPNINPRTIIDNIRNYAEQKIVPAMQREQANASIEIDNIAAAPAFECELDAALTQLVMTLTQSKELHKVAYGTEAGLFQEANIPTILCGPGSIEQAHRANEYVEISQLQNCEAFLSQVVVKSIT